MEEIDEVIEIYEYPPVLAKACFDQYHYTLTLKNNTVLIIEYAAPISKKWVHVSLYDSKPCDRGLDLAIDSIMLIEDAAS